MIAKIADRYAMTKQGARDFVKSIFLTVLVNISKMLPVFVLSYALTGIIDALGNGGDVKARLIPSVTGSVIALVVLYVTFLVQYRSLYVTTYAESGKRRIALAELLRHLPLSFFGKRDLSDLTSTMMSDCELLEKAFSHFYPQMIGTYVSTILIAIAMLVYEWRMAVALLWVVPVSVVLVYASRYFQKSHMVKNVEARRTATDALQELLEKVPDIRACNRNEAYLAELDGKLDAAEAVNRRSELVTGSIVTAAQTFLKVGIATTVLAGITLLSGGVISLTVFLMFLIAATRFYDPLGGLFANMAAVFATQVRIERMRVIQNEKQMTGTTAFSPANYDIRFDHVTFSYQDSEDGSETVLKDVSFTARQGEVTALVGPSGGGKSTATKLAARFWDPQEGSVLIGGIDVKTVDPEVLLTDVAIVFQDVVLFADTVMENIRIGKKDATDEEVTEAARLAQCDEFVRKLPEGYNTMIGENGAKLSGGERQRISIARAMLKGAKVILLDEATASLDVENESAVQTALTGLIKDKTVLIIAHRMRTVMNADQIVYLSEGKVQETGTPKELMSRGGLFARMVRLQA
ncbi:MAG: ABC transporter ATP-binding protein [Lachnospiraceae bacterium]|nr:ABC transporter ATP-binding protein [Lachnospiraceae bacterium]